MLFSLILLLLLQSAGAGSRLPQRPQIPAPAQPTGAPIVFRRLGDDRQFPELQVVDSTGAERTLSYVAEIPTVVAFLRPDQSDSKRVLADLSTLALDDEAPASRLIVIGLKGRREGGWPALQRGWPRELELFFDEYGASKQVGLVAVPSVAVLNRNGRLESALILHEPGFLAHLRRNLTDLAAGRTAGPDEAEQLQARFEQMSANAAGLEAAGQRKAAIELRREQLGLGLHPAAVQAALGRLCLLDEQAHAAVDHFRKSLEREDNLSVRVGLGRALIPTGHLEEARRILSDALDSSPDRVIIHRALAEIARKHGDIDGALEQIKAALDLLQSRSAGGTDEQE